MLFHSNFSQKSNVSQKFSLKENIEIEVTENNKITVINTLSRKEVAEDMAFFFGCRARVNFMVDGISSEPCFLAESLLFKRVDGTYFIVFPNSEKSLEDMFIRSFSLKDGNDILYAFYDYDFVHDIVTWYGVSETHIYVIFEDAPEVQIIKRSVAIETMLGISTEKELEAFVNTYTVFSQMDQEEEITQMIAIGNFKEEFSVVKDQLPPMEVDYK